MSFSIGMATQRRNRGPRFCSISTHERLERVSVVPKQGGLFHSPGRGSALRQAQQSCTCGWTGSYTYSGVRKARRKGGAAGADVSGDILAPMPGAVLNVLVAEGERVERNQTVVVMESMKMELLITAPRDGVVRRVSVQPGQQVERGMRLMELAPAGDSDEG